MVHSDRHIESDMQFKGGENPIFLFIVSLVVHEY